MTTSNMSIFMLLKIDKYDHVTWLELLLCLRSGGTYRLKKGRPQSTNMIQDVKKLNAGKRID